MALQGISSLKDRRRSLRRRMTAPEIILWNQLRNAQLGVSFRRQHGIGPYIVDFYCPKARLILEIDGITHEGIRSEKEDERRTSYLQSLGLQVIRFTNIDVMSNLEGVLITIQNKLQ